MSAKENNYRSLCCFRAVKFLPVSGHNGETIYEYFCRLCKKKCVVIPDYEAKNLKARARAEKKAQGQNLRLKARMDKKVSQLKARAKRPSIKQLRKKLWLLVSREVRASSDRCFTCGKQLEYKDRSACHFWPKSSHPSVRYDKDNLRSGCNTCNLFLHGNLAEYSIRLREEIGDERFDALASRAHQNHKFTRGELESLILQYEKPTVGEQV